MSGFSITRGGGFHIRFENGWTISVQFGDGTYSDNYLKITPEETRAACQSSTTAELAIIDPDGELYTMRGEAEVFAYQKPADLLEMMNTVAAFLPKPPEVVK